MSEWKTYTMEEVIEHFIDYRGKTPKKTTYGIPLITAKIVKNGFIEEPDEFIAEDYYDSWMRRGLPEIGDVVMTTEAPLGEVAQIKTSAKIALGQRIITLRGKPDLLDNTFLRFILQGATVQGRLKARGTGSTVQGIKSSELKKVQIDLPPLPEQKKIACVLGNIDDKIELNRRMNKTLEAMVMTLYRHYFIDFGLPPGAKYETDESPFGKLCDTDEMGPVPDGWRISLLGDYINVKHGFAFKGQYFSEEETDKILLTPGNFRIGGGFSDKKFKFYNDDNFPKDYILNKNDLIITMTDLSVGGDTLGFPAFVPTITNKVLLHNQRLGKVEFKNSEWKFKYFIYHLLCTKDYRSSILGSASGTTVKHTSPSRIMGFEFICPSDEMLRIFEKKAEKLFNQIAINQEEMNILISIRNFLLPKLLSGEVIIQ